MPATSSVTDVDFDSQVLASDKPVLVDFWAPWCGPCKALAPTLESLAAEYDGKLRIAKMDVDENAASRERFGVRGIPMLALYKDGAEVARLTGVQSRARLAAFLDLHLQIESTVATPEVQDRLVTAFNGDRQVRDRCIDRLARHAAGGTVRPGITAWDGEAGSPMGCAAECATPEGCAEIIGVPSSIIGIVDTLSTYYGTADGGTNYALEWLKAIPVGRQLSDLPLQLLSLILEDGMIEQEIRAWPAATELRDEIMAAHRARSDEQLGNAEWAALRTRTNNLANEASKPMGQLLENAAYPLYDPDALRTVLLTSTTIYMAAAMRDHDWTREDEERALELLNALHAKQAGSDADVSDVVEEFRKMEPELAARFDAASRQRSTLMREAGQAVGMRLLDLTRSAADACVED